MYKAFKPTRGVHKTLPLHYSNCTGISQGGRVDGFKAELTSAISPLQNKIPTCEFYLALDFRRTNFQ